MAIYGGMLGLGFGNPFGGDSAAGPGVGVGLSAWHPNPTALAPVAALHPNPTGISHNLFLGPFHPNPTGLRLDGPFHPNPTGLPHHAPTWPTGGDPQPSVADASVPRPIFPATASPWPWTGIDPAWVYASDDALMAQAMRKTRAKILRPRDDRLPRPSARALAPPDEQLDALWRWEPPWRIQAAVADAIGRVAIEWEPPVAAGAAALAQQPGLPPPAGRRFHLRPVDSQGRRLATVLDLLPPEGQFDYGPQIDKVVRAAVEREDRLPEILSQMADLRSFFAAVAGIAGLPLPALAELLQVATDWATLIVMRVKHGIAELRPFQRSALVMPVIPTPGHGSLPSGHATMAALYAELLAQLLYPQDDARAELLHRLACRIAYNRVVAGVHFQMDSAAGQALGLQLAALFVALAKGGEVAGWRCPIDSQSQWSEMSPLGRVGRRGRARSVVEPSRVLGLMWERACTEWTTVTR